jgi:hypothetical protein
MATLASRRGAAAILFQIRFDAARRARRRRRHYGSATRYDARRLRCRILPILAVASGMLAVGVCVMWVRSKLLFEEWNVLAPPANGAHIIRWKVTSLNGGIGLMVPGGGASRVGEDPTQPLGLIWYQRGRAHPTAYPAGSIPDRLPWHGFIFARRGWNLPRTLPPLHLYITVPYWSVLAVTAALPTLWVVRRRRERIRNQASTCRVCGYDLRATPDRCPECGAVPAIPSPLPSPSSLGDTRSRS